MFSRRAFRHSLGPLPLISLVLVACANSGAGDRQSSGSDPNDLVGVVWVLDEASISRLVADVPTEAQVTLTFEDGQAHGSAACNSYGGAYQASDDGSLSFDSFAVTQMACDPALMTLETAYLEVLGGVSAFEVGTSGDLSLSNGDTTLTFAPQVTPEPLPLVGTMWTLSSISSGDVVTSVISGTEITVGSRPTARWADRPGAMVSAVGIQRPETRCRSRPSRRRGWRARSTSWRRNTSSSTR